MPNDFAPAPDLTTPANLEVSVIQDLLHLPEQIARLQAQYDDCDLIYRRLAAAAALEGLRALLFADAKTGEARVASNEREREIAIEAELTMQIDAGIARTNLDEARRALQQAKNQFEAAQLIVRLLCRKDN
jgi:hypothetical protein